MICKECGGHIPEEIDGDMCDDCIINRESKVAEKLYGEGTDEERQAAMLLWDI